MKIAGRDFKTFRTICRIRWFRDSAMDSKALAGISGRVRAITARPHGSYTVPISQETWCPASVDNRQGADPSPAHTQRALLDRAGPRGHP